LFALRPTLILTIKDIVLLQAVGFYGQGDNEFIGLGKATATGLGPA
jgi:hypothetical protein